MGEWTAIVLAGSRPGENGFAESHGVAAKALIPVGGGPMLGRVLDTLLASASIGRIVVLAQQPHELLRGALGWAAGHERIAMAVAGDGISASIARIAGSAEAPWPVLVTTADHALLTPDMVEAFITGSDGVDASFAMVERRVVEQVHPGTRRTWIKLSDGHFSGANLFALRTPAAQKALAFWARAERDRKKALRLLMFFGPTIFLRAFTRTIGLDAAVAKAGRDLGIRLGAVRLPFPEAAIDVDKPADLELVERILAEGAAGTGTLKTRA
jgi:GTP:adenosylcobinamide-phosphate guanylyltransferase